MEQNYINLSVPHLVGNEKKYVSECIDSNWISAGGAYTKKFEDEFAKYTGAEFAVAVSSGTAALHLSLIAAGVKRGEGVFAPTITFVAPINAISYVGANPVFVDVDNDSLGISPESVQQFINKFCYFKEGVLINRFSNEKISAILAVHIYGHSARIDELREIATAYNLALIEDASEAIGTRYKDKHVGTFGRFGCFSFSGNKLLATGNGGIVLTNSEESAERIRHLRQQATTDTQLFYHDEVGYNYRMSNIAAALGLAQMEYLPQTITSKRKIHFMYEQAFDKLDEVKLFTELEWCRSNYWMAIIQVPAKSRDEFTEFMSTKHIESRPLWELNNRHPMYSACSCANIDNSMDLYESVVAIPCNQAMSDDDVQRVIDAVVEFSQSFKVVEIEEPREFNSGKTQRIPELADFNV